MTTENKPKVCLAFQLDPSIKYNDLVDSSMVELKDWTSSDRDPIMAGKARPGLQTFTDVWALIPKNPSHVSVQNQDIYNPNLRQSVSIKDKFSIPHIPDLFHTYFSKIQIGTGSKHVYYRGNFMKRHYDTRKPDLKELPHIMTLVITDSLSELIVDGKSAEYYLLNSINSKDHYRGKYCVLFTLDCSHEVEPICISERHSFTFPVYGEYNPFWKIPKSVPTYNCYDVILTQLEEFNYIEFSILEGLLKILNDEDINMMSIRIRLENGECFCPPTINESYLTLEDDSLFKISYEDETGHHERIEKELVFLTGLHLKNIKIEGLDVVDRLLYYIKKRVLKLKEENEKL